MTRKKYFTYVSLVIHRHITDDIDQLIEKVGYWPSRNAFAREACLEKIHKEKRKLNSNPED